MGLCIWSDWKIHHSQDSLFLELCLNSTENAAVYIWSTKPVCEQGGCVKMALWWEMSSSVQTTWRISSLCFPGIWQTCLPCTAVEAVKTAILGNIWKKGFCAHCKILTLVLTIWSLYRESCAILICEFKKLFIYQYMTCLAICFSTAVQ